jgi:hypothetical protein
MGLPIITTLISTGVGMFSSMQQGKSQAAAANYERVQYEEQRKVAEIQALDEESTRRKRLEQVMATNRAAAVGLGISGESRSFMAIQDDSQAEAEKDIGRIRLNGAQTRRSLTMAADMKKMEAKSAKRSGLIGAVGTLFDGGTKIGNMWQG